ncbi:MAG TPA: hypothetical protein VH413_18530 [Verrucomicrobiae bacterium]|nr:hypothetical protein [Verrucomicrobiae bacterium]
MSYKTVEVELENGTVRPSGAEILPSKAHALLTLLDETTPGPAATCSQLADRWNALAKLPSDEAKAFANDIEKCRLVFGDPIRN